MDTEAYLDVAVSSSPKNAEGGGEAMGYVLYARGLWEDEGNEWS